MAVISLDKRTSLVIAVDIQERFLDSIWEADRVLRRSVYLIQVAKALRIPVLATAQNPSRLGSVPDQVSEAADLYKEKMSFSCMNDAALSQAILNQQKDQVVLVGVETHICIALTASDLIERGFEVVVCPDAVSSSTQDRHRLGMERIRDSGILPSHTETVAYEWVRSADAPEFKDLLRLTKQFA